MKDLNVGVVGLGWVAGAHIQTFKKVKGMRPAAVCSRRDLNPAALEAEYGVPLKAYNDYEAMLKDPSIDVIDICTPHPMHPDQAVAAAQAGKHLIIEKPISISFQDLKRVRDAVKKASVKACVCFECRYSAHFTMIRSVIDQGLLGKIHYAEVDYYHGIGPWYGQYGWNIRKDMGGSSLLTAGCHALDGLLFFVDDQVESVHSLATKSTNENFTPYEYDTTTVTTLKVAGGRTVAKVTSCVDCLQPYYFHIHLVGDQGSLLDNRIYSAKLKGMTKQRWSTLETALIDSGDVSDHPYLPQFQAFADAVHAGREMPYTDFATAYESHRVVFAADKSAAEGRVVRMAEMV